MEIGKAQVERTHYKISGYGYAGRFVSYFNQISLAIKTNPSSILEIGSGDKVFSSYIKQNTKIEVKTLDLAEDLNPDVIGDIRSIPFADKSFDTVCAFEVLEHIPFEEVKTALGEMFRVSKNYVFISVPHFSPQFKFLLKIPFIPEIKFAIKIPYFKKHKFDGEHYWELGKSGFKKSRLKNLLKEYGEVEMDFIPFENQYHHFILVKKTNN